MKDPLCSFIKLGPFFMKLLSFFAKRIDFLCFISNVACGDNYYPPPNAVPVFSPNNRCVIAIPIAATSN